MTSHNFFTAARLRAATIATVAAVGLVLTGCNTGGGPGGTDTASPAVSQTPSVTATPTPTATPAYVPASASGRAQNVPVPVLPEVAKTETKEGLEAFARYWYATLSYAYETGDTQPLETISGPSCQSCAKVKAEVTDWHSEGRWISGGKLHVEGAHSDFVALRPGEYQAVVQVYQDTIDYYLADGRLKGSLPRKPAVGDILLVAFDGGGWKANTVEHLVN